jgi:hypothetical protein
MDMAKLKSDNQEMGVEITETMRERIGCFQELRQATTMNQLSPTYGRDMKKR